MSQNYRALSRDLGASLAMVLSQGWGLRSLNVSDSFSFRLWAKIKSPQCVRFQATSLPVSLTEVIRSLRERLRILFLNLKEFCPSGSVLRTLGVSMALLFVFRRTRVARCLPAWLLWRRNAKGCSDEEGEKLERISPCSHPGWGTRAHCWLF